MKTNQCNCSQIFIDNQNFNKSKGDTPVSASSPSMSPPPFISHGWSRRASTNTICLPSPYSPRRSFICTHGDNQRIYFQASSCSSKTHAKDTAVESTIKVLHLFHRRHHHLLPLFFISYPSSPPDALPPLPQSSRCVAAVRSPLFVGSAIRRGFPKSNRSCLHTTCCLKSFFFFF